MDHMGMWMLPGAALALVVVVGIALVTLDDVVLAILRLGRKSEAAPLESGVIRETTDKGRGRRSRLHPRRFLRRTEGRGQRFNPVR